MESILLVDDEKILRYTFGEFLESGGYKVATASNYDSALEKIEDETFDLIITDIILGGKTGIDLLGKIKEKGLNCPVIVLTGYPDVQTASEAVRLGAFNYLSKPVDQHNLLNSAGIALKYKKALDQEEKYRSNIQAIFKSVKEGIITVDHDMRIVELNDSALKTCGLDRMSIGKNLDSIKTGCNKKCLEALRETISTKSPVELPGIECQSKENREQMVNITTSPFIDESGNHAGAVMVISDETRLINLERELKERRQFKNIIGSSSRMQEIYRMIESLADVDSTVLIIGESGTGKELVAEALHYSSAKKSKGSLIFINCAAIPENLIESELFGHEKGAFTGAIATQRGKFELASNGTIVLDEIGDMPLNLQTKLLRVLEQSEIQRVGSEKTITINTRVIAATNKDLREKVKSGEFREDLYYRLKVVEIPLPPLRDRLADIKILSDHFVSKFSKKFKKDIKGISPEVETLLMEHEWPGNVRELEHLFEHAAILCNSQIIDINDLPRDFIESLSRKTRATKTPGEDEAELIKRVLEENKWNKTDTASQLGMDRSTLYRKMIKYKLY